MISKILSSSARVGIAVLSLSAMAVAANAADMPIKAPPYKAMPLRPLDNWTGFYVGAHAGYGFGNTDWRFPLAEYYNTAPGQAFDSKPKGFMAGSHAGYNYQYGSWVYGLEVGYDPMKLKQSLTGPVVAIFPQDKFETSFAGLVTVTGRIGYAMANWLLYAKGGWANDKLELNAVSGPPGAGVTASVSKRVNGGVVGLGAEYMLTRHIVLGLEYDYIKFQNASFSSTTSIPSPFHIDASKVNLQTVMARASYKF